jgi:hypothetical protein
LSLFGGFARGFSVKADSGRLLARILEGQGPSSREPGVFSTILEPQAYLFPRQLLGCSWLLLIACRGAPRSPQFSTPVHEGGLTPPSVSPSAHHFARGLPEAPQITPVEHFNARGGPHLFLSPSHVPGSPFLGQGGPNQKPTARILLLPCYPERNAEIENVFAVAPLIGGWG